MKVSALKMKTHNVKELINAIDKHPSDHALKYSSEIPSIVNTFKKNYFFVSIYNYFDSRFYYDHGDIFSYPCRIFVLICFENIGHTKSFND